MRVMSETQEFANSLSVDEIMSNGGFDKTRFHGEDYEKFTVWEKFEHGERFVLGTYDDGDGVFCMSVENNMELTRVSKMDFARTMLTQGDTRRLTTLATEVSVGPPKSLAEFAYRAGAGYHVPDTVGPPSERIVFDPFFRNEVKRFQDQEEARRYAMELAEEKALDLDPNSMWEPKRLDQFLDETPLDNKWLVEGLVPAGGNTAITASAKTGKTTFVLNLSRDLLLNRRFLGAYNTTALTGRIGLLNYELTEKQCQEWLSALVDENADRFVVWNLRGKKNPLQTEVSRKKLARELREHSIQVLIVDPFSGAFRRGSAASMDNDLVKEFLIQLDEMKTEAGVSEMILVVHAGRNTSRSRGASSIDDHPDSLITLERDPETGLRKFRALGRDVQIDECILHFDFETKRLLLSDTTLAEEKLEMVETKILSALRQEGPLSATQLTSRIRKREAVVNKARDRLVEKGLVTVENLSGGRKLFQLSGRVEPASGPTPPL